MITRRNVLVSATAGVAAMAIPHVRADTVSPEAANIYRRALVFDANLVPPVQDRFPFPKKLLEMMRVSGITAMKSTLGGIDGTFEATIEDIAFMQRLVEAYPDLYMQVRRQDRKSV